MQASEREADEPRRDGPARAARFPLRQFCLELSILLDSGIALHEALTALQEKERRAHVDAVLRTVLDELRQGRSFGASLRGCGVFDPLFVAAIEAGQRTGQVASVLKCHAEYLAWVHQSRAKLVNASIYPAILLVAGSAVLLFLTIFVIPRFADLYQDLGADLPWLTGALLAVGSWVGEHSTLLLAGAALFAFGLRAAWRSRAARMWIADALWRLPRIGEPLRLVQLAKFHRTMGLLVQSGVTVPGALTLTVDAVALPMRNAVSAARDGVTQGRRLSDSLEAAGLSDAVSLRMIRVGEHTGELGRMMERVADFHDEELAQIAEWFGRVVGPLLMLMMGVAIGTVVVLMYMPIFDVAERIQ